MKRISYLYDEIISIANLQLAERNARRGKTHQKGVMLFDKDKDGNLQRLHEMLKNETFTTSPYVIFKVFEPKERIIYRLPYFPDRIIHHAVMNLLEPIWCKTFSYNTYSCINDRGITACAKQVVKIIRSFEGSPLYCLKIDIRKFYPSVDNEILKAIVRRKIKDVRLLRLLDNIIDSAKGLPIGNYLSQYLSNLYLCYFMHWCNEVLNIKCTEYADDIVYFSDIKMQLHQVLSQIRCYLENELHLTLKSNYQIFPIAETKTDRHGRALDYVGFQFFRRQILLRKRINQNFCRRVASLKGKQLTSKVFVQKVAPWLGWLKYSNSNRLKTKIMTYAELVANGTVKEKDDIFFDCEKVSIDALVNKEVDILDYTSDVETKQGEGRFVVKVNDNDKTVKFFTNCRKIKDALKQIPKDKFPVTTTIRIISEDNRRYYKFT